MSASKSRGQEWDPSALIDITNDSPIVGLANGVILDTPLTKQRGSRMKNTPGSGEDLLRGQVKTLLLKVEEEVEVSMFSLESSELLAPMPMNLSGLSSVTPSHVSQQPVVPQVRRLFTKEKCQEYVFLYNSIDKITDKHWFGWNYFQRFKTSFPNVTKISFSKINLNQTC